jgi:hypothetical protein
MLDIPADRNAGFGAFDHGGPKRIPLSGYQLRPMVKSVCLPPWMLARMPRGWANGTTTKGGASNDG